MEGIAAQSPPSPSSCRTSASSNPSSWLFALAHRSNNSSSSPGGNNSLSPSSSRSHHKTTAAAIEMTTTTMTSLVIPEQISVYNYSSLTNTPESPLLLGSNGHGVGTGSLSNSSNAEALVPFPTSSIVLPNELDRPGTPTTLSSTDEIIIMSDPLSPVFNEEGGDHAAVAASSYSSYFSYVSSFCRNHCGSSPDSRLSLAQLTVLIFYGVSGGAYGVEPSVQSAGNFYTLLGYTVFPFVWSVQEAMMTAELGAAFPEASGGVAWVEEAFGSKWGFVSGYLGWIAGATDNAIYPALFLEYLRPDSNTEQAAKFSIGRFFLLAVISIILSLVNWLGLPVVGNMSIAICALAMSPFVILIFWGAPKVEPSRWLQGSTNNALMMRRDLLRKFLNNMFWNLNSFDAGASFVEDIDDPGRVLPKAMGYSVVMVVLGYLLPLLVALGASKSSQDDWVDGHLGTVCQEIAGPWLKAWTVFAAGISNIALFQAELSADAFQLMGMAERGYLPEIFATRSRHGTPTYGILLGCGIIVALGALGAAKVDRLIEMLNFNYAVSLLMEYAAFLKLRVSRPDLPRPFRIPLSTFGCIVALVPTVFFTGLILALADWPTYAFAIVVNIVGFGLYYCKGYIREHQDHEQPIIPLVSTNYLSSRANASGGDNSDSSSQGSQSGRTGGIIFERKYERVDSTDATTMQTEDDTETLFSASTSTDLSGSISDNSVISQIIRSNNSGINNNNNNNNTFYNNDDNHNMSSSQEHR